jgi:RNA polymerase sigma-70 factor, ECF subfamily
MSCELTELAAVHGGAILRRARGYAPDAATAADLSQEVLLRTVRSWDGVRDQAHPSAWMHAVLRNVAIDHQRSRHRRLVPAGDALPEVVADHDVVREVLARDPEGRVAAAIAALPAPARDVVVLRFYDDLDLATIADRLGIHPGTVRTRLHRALRRLRSLLEDLDDSQAA